MTFFRDEAMVRRYIAAHPQYALSAIRSGIAEAQRLIDKEMKYSPDLRKADYLAGLHEHIEWLSQFTA